MSLNTILATAPLTTTNYILKATGTTIGNSLIWDNGTNVGIGNTNTSYTLDVSGTGRFSSNVNIDGEYLTIGGATNNAVINNIASFRFNLDCDNTGTGESFTVGHNQTIINDSNVLFRIQDNGNVGIGTSSPDSKLQVAGTCKIDSALTCVSEIIVGGSGSYPTGGVGFRNDGTNFNIYYGANNCLFKDVSNVERMRITSGGDVFVGFSGSAAGQRLRVQGADSGSVNYSLVVANSTTASTFLVRNDGAVQVVGSLSKGSGSFRIDHPLESMTKTHQLVHSFIEGPRVDLIYRGKLTLVNGKAEANIDEISTMTIGTFEALCREVQCFTTNESGWDLVKGKVIGNIIYIESQNTNSTDEISWMVIGERKDKHIIDTDWTDENGKVIVEPLKTNLPTIQNLQEQINILAK